MGSLMSGWSSSVLSDKEARLMRNRSMTKDEVAAFWRQQQQHGTPAPDPNAAGSPRAETVLLPLAARRRQLEATRSLPPRAGGTRSNDHLTCCASYGYGAGGLQQFDCSSRSEPPSSPVTENAAAAADNSGTTRGWWTRSSSAFLNEQPPPTSREEEVLLGRPHRRSFACGDHFHAARIVTGNA